MDEKTRKRFSEVIGMEIPIDVNLKVEWSSTGKQKEAELRPVSNDVNEEILNQLRKDISKTVSQWPWVFVNDLHFTGLNRYNGKAIAAKGSAIIWKIADDSSGEGECDTVSWWNVTVNGKYLAGRAIVSEQDDPRLWADECLEGMINGTFESQEAPRATG